MVYLNLRFSFWHNNTGLPWEMLLSKSSWLQNVERLLQTTEMWKTLQEQSKGWDVLKCGSSGHQHLPCLRWARIQCWEFSPCWVLTSPEQGTEGWSDKGHSNKNSRKYLARHTVTSSAPLLQHQLKLVFLLLFFFLLPAFLYRSSTDSVWVLMFPFH